MTRLSETATSWTMNQEFSSSLKHRSTTLRVQYNFCWHFYHEVGQTTLDGLWGTKKDAVLRLGGVYFSMDSRTRNNAGRVLGGVGLGISGGDFIIVAKPGNNNGSALTGVVVKVRRPATNDVLCGKRSVASLSVGRETGLKVNFTFRRPIHFGNLAIHSLLRVTIGGDIGGTRLYNCLSRIKLYTTSCVGHRVGTDLSNNRLGEVRVTVLVTENTSLSIFSRPRTNVSL